MRCACPARLLILGALLAQLCAAAAGARGAAAAAAVSPAADHSPMVVGRLTLQRCQTAAPWCGTLVRALDPSGALAGTIPIYFEYYPHSAAGPAAGTLVATEGGPGYPATESRDEYLALFGPLRADHDVLIMDNRGTGRSGALDCRELQNAPLLTEADIGACGRFLGPAAPLYSTALAGDDLAALLDALAVGRIDLYGDSYGTYFAQVFALRHPHQLRSLVLDGAYPLDGPDYAWYPHYAPAMREKFSLACARSAACKALPGSSLDHMAPALAQLRARPFEAKVRYGEGQLMTLSANATALAIVMFGGSPAYSSVRETDAAARAFSAGDSLPLLRLMAETKAGVDSRDPTHSPALFSAGLAAAVFCTDPPQVFDVTLPPAQRLASREAAMAKREHEAPDTYAPFTIGEYRRMPLDYAFIDECVQWPSRPAHAAALVPAGARYPPVPVLVVSGELDNMTSVADGAAAAALFPRAHHVILANSFHVNALPSARSECGARLVRRFIQTLASGDESCAAAVPPVPLVPRFARWLRELDPAQASSANQASPTQLRVVTAALFTAADVLARAQENGAGRGIGLRGGTFTSAAVGGGYRLHLTDVRWTEDLSVSGSLEAGGQGAVVRADLDVSSPAGAGKLLLSWPQGAGGARATAAGKLGAERVDAQAEAP
jgi:pimeloyl-ACP methyl ester carboxylesterase